MSEYREQVHETEIAATPEQVWAMLTVPEEIAKWYGEEASVEPHEGGAYRISWGGGMEATSRIVVWDPPRRLRLVSAADQAGMPGSDPVTEELTTEMRGDRTVLRMTFSLPRDDAWDAFYDGTNLGWQVCFALMRHTLERHPGAPVTKMGIMGTSPHAPRDLFARATEMLGDLPASGPYALRTPLDDAWSGEVLLRATPSGRFGNWALTLTVADLRDALFHIGAERHGASTLVYGGLVSYGEADATIGKAYRDLVAERLDLTEM